MEKVRIGVFGGARGFDMFWTMLYHPDAEVVAVCDKYEPLLEKCNKAAADAGKEIALFDSFEDFIKYDMDAVVLANYATEHAIYAVKALEAGKHVMSEVLPGETPAQIVNLIEAVNRTGLIYCYAENYCYMKHTFEMWRRYRTGEIGEIQYAEGEYIHDCTSIWPSITYGEKGHWRNRIPPTYYCTHSCGPLITITGLRAVRVVGFETNINTEAKQFRIGLPACAGIEMMTLENGAIVKSIHGGLKMEPGSINYQLYGTKGMMQTGRYGPKGLNIYKEGPKFCQGEWESYDPENRIAKEIADKTGGHNGGDFYPSHFFIQKILGRPEGEWAIDVYKAANMGMVGLLAYKSILAGNIPMDIPDFRILAERDKFRHDNACTTPWVAGDALQPMSSHETYDFPDSVYENVRKQWLGEENPLSELY